MPFIIPNLIQNNIVFWKCVCKYVKEKEHETRGATIENGSRVPGPDRADRESSSHLKSRALAESREQAAGPDSPQQFRTDFPGGHLTRM